MDTSDRISRMQEGFSQSSTAKSTDTRLLRSTDVLVREPAMDVVPVVAGMRYGDISGEFDINSKLVSEKSVSTCTSCTELCKYPINKATSYDISESNAGLQYIPRGVHPRHTQRHLEVSTGLERTVRRICRVPHRAPANRLDGALRVSH